MELGSGRREERVSADSVPLPRGYLESSSERILPSEAAGFCGGAYFWALRLAWPCRSGRVSQTQNTICHRSHRNVRADRTEHFFEACVLRALGQRDDCRSSRGT